MTARTGRMLGGHEVTIYDTALGEIWVTTIPRDGPKVKILGQQECTHYLTAAEARDVAGELLRAADDLDRTLAR